MEKKTQVEESTTNLITYVQLYRFWENLLSLLRFIMAINPNDITRNICVFKS